MECPNCKKHIKSNRNRCNYCNKKNEKSFFRKFWDFLNSDGIDEKKIIKTIADGNIPTITSSREMELYLEYKIQDEEIAIIVTETLYRIGQDGLVEVKRGGVGNPYKIEDLPRNLTPCLSRREIKKRKQELTRKLREIEDLSEVEEENIKNELSQLTRYHTIIWINSKSQSDFEDKRQSIMKAIELFGQILKNQR